MGGHAWIPSLGLCSVMLLGSMGSGCYDMASYRTRYAMPTAGQPAVAAAASVPTPGTAPVGVAAPAALGVAAPQPAEPTAGLAALPPLNLPVHEDWSSARCPDIAVTFSGRSQPLQSSPSDSALFQEARQFRDHDYYEVAECFCTKYGNLSQTTRSDADVVMTQTAQQFAAASHLRVRSASFVEDGPLGKYSEFQAAAQPPSATAAALRTYWRGQCSMRVEAIWDQMTSVRALQFLNSLHEIKEAAAGKAEAAPDEAAPDAPLADPAPKVTTNDLAAELEQRHKDMMKATANATPAVAAAPSSPAATAATEAPSSAAAPATADAASSAAATGAAQQTDTALRLKQLKELEHKGFISKDEYETKRQSILNSL